MGTGGVLLKADTSAKMHDSPIKYTFSFINISDKNTSILHKTIPIMRLENLLVFVLSSLLQNEFARCAEEEEAGFCSADSESCKPVCKGQRNLGKQTKKIFENCVQ